FCHATGYQAASSGLDNMHNYFDNIYKARYVSGVVAGLKLNEMIENGDITEDQARIGYVGAYPYAEVISGFTSFYLGAKSQCPAVGVFYFHGNGWALAL
ncbi:BMP family ABC transporter substrate-binding protein, partial [Lacrimispora saccharolytica]|nr:BMP family ABC transporter substrate-binding protein [Lacrimispora saccharolytica]